MIAQATRVSVVPVGNTIDPVKVTRSALANAASIASLLLTTETSVVEKPAKDEAEHSHGHSH